MNRKHDRALTPEESLRTTLDAVAAQPAPANAERLTRQVRFHFANGDVAAPLLLSVNGDVPASAAIELAESLLVYLQQRCTGAVSVGQPIEVDEANTFALLLDLALTLYTAAGENA